MFDVGKMHFHRITNLSILGGFDTLCRVLISTDTAIKSISEEKKL